MVRKYNYVYEKANTQCVVVEDGLRCKRGIHNVMRSFCGMHYGRWLRNGTTDTPKRGKAAIENRLKSLEMQRERAEARHLTREKRFSNIKQLTKEMCICGHARIDHIRTMSQCKRSPCKCKKFQKTNEYELEIKQKRLLRFGFIEHVNNEAKCSKCYEVIKIGSWIDPMIMRRAANHVSRECASRYKSLYG